MQWHERNQLNNHLDEICQNPTSVEFGSSDQYADRTFQMHCPRVTRSAAGLIFEVLKQSREHIKFTQVDHLDVVGDQTRNLRIRHVVCIDIMQRTELPMIIKLHAASTG